MVEQGYKRMLLMAGLAAVRRDSLFSHVDRVAVYVTLAGPGPVEGNNIKIIIINIKGKRKCLFDKEIFASIVFDFYRADDCVQVFKNSVDQGNLSAKKVVGRGDFESSAVVFCTENCRQARQSLCSLNSRLLLRTPSSFFPQPC